MANRRLTDRQRRQIEQNAEKRRENSLPKGEDLEGIIIARFSKAAVVMDEQHEMHRCHLRPNLAHLVAGDRVLWQKTNRALWSQHN